MFVTSDDLVDGHQDNPIRLCLRLIAKTGGGTLEVPAYKEENFAVPEKISIFEKRLAKDCPKVHKGLPKVCWELFRSYSHFVMAYAYGYSKPYSTTDKERSESCRGNS